MTVQIQHHIAAEVEGTWYINSWPTMDFIACIVISSSPVGGFLLFVCITVAVMVKNPCIDYG